VIKVAGVRQRPNANRSFGSGRPSVANAVSDLDEAFDRWLAGGIRMMAQRQRVTGCARNLTRPKAMITDGFARDVARLAEPETSRRSRIVGHFQELDSA
jgi:hypothetical protein